MVRNFALSTIICLFASTAFGGETLYQTSTIQSLLDGVYEQEMTLDQVKQHGDFGLGTFDHLNGEMVFVDGVIYRVKSDGSIQIPADNEKTPFSAVTTFVTDATVKIRGADGFDSFAKAIDPRLPSPDIFYAIRIDGTFSHIKARSAPPQKKPYPPLKEVLKTQSFFEFHNIKGTLIGLWCPDYSKGINVPGYHFHFLTEDRMAGGHVLDFSFTGVEVKIDYLHKLSLTIPHVNNESPSLQPH